MTDELEEKIADKHGSTGRFIYREGVKRFIEGEIDAEQLLDRVMEFARGNWTLTVDENRHGGLTRALVARGYNADEIRPAGITDEEIKRRYRQGSEKGVFVTADRSDFSLADVPAVFPRGLILLPDIGQPDQQARAIENVLMHWRDDHSGEPVRVRLTKQDVVTETRS
jgi:hypothetical protein